MSLVHVSYNDTSKQKRDTLHSVKQSHDHFVTVHVIILINGNILNSIFLGKPHLKSSCIKKATKLWVLIL